MKKMRNSLINFFFLTFAFLILTFIFLPLHFEALGKEIYKRESFQLKDFLSNPASKKTSILDRNYPGGVDEEDLKVTEFKEPKVKITKSSLEKKALKNLKSAGEEFH